MTREALLVANSVNYSEMARSISAREIKRTIRRFAGLLEDLPNPYRFHVTSVFDARPKEVRERVSSVAEKAANSDSLFLFYYFGHGLLSAELELMFLHPPGPRGNHETLRLSTVESDLKATDVKRSLFVIDCCYAGAQYRTFSSSLTGEHCRIASTTPSERAYVVRNAVDDPIGIFTRSVMDGLTSSNACVAATDNRITVESLFRYASNEVAKRTSTIQKPRMLGNLSEPLTLYQPKPQIILGVSKAADEKTTYSKILAICRILASEDPPQNLNALYRILLSQHPTAFQTLYKVGKGKFEYRPVQQNVISRYVRLLRSLGLISPQELRLSETGEKLATRWRSSYNRILLESVDKYLSQYDIGRDDIEHALRQILASREVPTKIEALDYLSVGRSLPKDELGIVLDLLGYTRAIRMSTGHAYFPW